MQLKGKILPKAEKFTSYSSTYTCEHEQHSAKAKTNDQYSV